VRNIEERYENLRRSHACAPLSREGVTELLSITGNLIDERRRVRRVLERLPESFAEVRQLLNELNRAVR
jgi:adenylylsulfate kinase-like enzyme